MRIRTLKIKNFRGYQKEITVPFESLTVFVGKNDVGKSSILEAMDLFFNDGKGTVKLDKNDINRTAEMQGDTETVISVCFDSIPDEVILDATNATDLRNEFLLNPEDNLEIVKKYQNGGNCKTFIRAVHPRRSECCDLLSKKDSELRKTIEINEIPCCDKTRNASMRKAIWSYYEEDLQTELVDIDVSKGDTKSIWDKLQKYLPIYSLFQADRKNTDGDVEIQDPLREAVKQILSDSALREKLDYVASVVERRLKEVSSRTLDKLNEMSPEVASSLEPVIPSPEGLKWTEVFKGVSIFSEDNIPLNKRGSGVKRLVLLNFFRAEIERRQEESQSTNVIYAIEEPETSQHTENQIKLVQAFKELSANPNIQVIMSTHSGAVVRVLSFENLRLIRNKNGNKSIEMIDPSQLPYPSLNEVNYLAFSEVSEEYHNELYGFLAYNKWVDDMAKNQPMRSYIALKKDSPQNPTNIALTTYIRHQIHHPENTLNPRYSKSDLKQSIDLMRDYIKKRKAAGIN